MAKNYLLIYAEQLATDIELLCQNIKAPSNTLFQLRKSSSSVYANIHEAQYAQGKKDFISKIEIALKEASETGYWLELLLRNIWRCRSNAYTYKFTVCLHNLVDKRWGEWYYFYNKILPFKGE